MKKSLKKADFTIIQAPVYVEGECPHCNEHLEYELDKFGDSGDPANWPGDIVNCNHCNKEIIIDDINWN